MPIFKENIICRFFRAPFFGSRDGEILPQKRAILQWVLIKAFPMISRVPKGVIGSMVIFYFFRPNEEIHCEEKERTTCQLKRSTTIPKKIKGKNSTNVALMS
jgi:hypothetical protein